MCKIIRYYKCVECGKKYKTFRINKVTPHIGPFPHIHKVDGKICPGSYKDVILSTNSLNDANTVYLEKIS